MSSEGVTPTLVYDGDVGANLAGGLKQGVFYAGAIQLQMLVDSKALFDTPGLSFYADILNTHGEQPSELVGDIQGVSNIAAAPYTRVYEAWAQYNLFETSILFGRFDLNTEFYRLSSSSLFLNSSFGIGPEFSQSGPAGASVYPDTALGARFAYKPEPNVVFRVAVMDGAPVERPSSFGGVFSSKDGLLIMSELAFLTRPGVEPEPGAMRSLIGRMSSLPPYADKIAIGGWYYTTSLDDLSELSANGTPVMHRGSSGEYFLLDKRLFESGGAHINGFLQVGLGDPRVDRVGSYIGFGLAADGLNSSRPNDRMGIAIAIAKNGSHFQNASSAAGTPYDSAETALEFTYVTEATRWLAIQPDLQYVIHPGATPGTPDALVFQIKIEASF